METNNVGLENIYLDKNSLANSESILNASRKDSLTQAEKNTYNSMDSLSRAKHLDYKIKLIKKLYDTKIPAGIVDLDLRWLYNVNNYEGQRLGMGIRTNNKLSGFVAFEVFGGYGWKDDKLKYGGEITLDLDKYNEGQLRLSYLNDLKETGMDMVTDHSRLSYYDELRRNIGYRFDKGVEYKAELAWRFWHDFKIYGTLSLKELEPGYDYQFRGKVLDRYPRRRHLRIAALRLRNKVDKLCRYTFGDEKWKSTCKPHVPPRNQLVQRRKLQLQPVGNHFRLHPLQRSYRPNRRKAGSRVHRPKHPLQPAFHR